MTKKNVIKMLFGFFIVAFVILFIYNRTVKSEIEDSGIRTIGIILNKEPYFKGGPYLNYYYFVDNIKFTGSDSYYSRDKHDFVSGDSIVISYLINRKQESRLLKDKNNNVILYVNRMQIDSLNFLKK
jgi:hypothetical protein